MSSVAVYVGRPWHTCMGQVGVGQVGVGITWLQCVWVDPGTRKGHV